MSTANLLERRKPMVRAGEHASYGLGLGVGTYRGVEVVSHGGGTMGFNSLAEWLPEQGVGLVLLTNTPGGRGPS